MYKYIIVDDEPLIRKGLLKKISSFDQEIVFSGEAQNGDEALNLIKESDPDIIITDMRMPGMDGKSLLRIIQQDYPSKKVIVISGYTDFEYTQEAISAKVVSYLLKPFNRDEVHNALRSAISLIEKETSYKKQLETIEGEKEQIIYSSDIQTLSNTILGIHKKEAMPEIKSERLKLIGNTNCYLLFTLYFSKGNHKNLFLEYVTKNPFDETFILVPHPNSDNLHFFILLISKSEEEIFYYSTEKAESFIQFFRTTIGIQVFLGISKPKNSISLLNDAYKETLTALDSRCLSDNKGYCLFAEDEITENIVEWDKLEDLVFFLESGNTDKVIELVSDFFNMLNKLPDISLAAAKHACLDILDKVRDLLHENVNITYNKSISSSYQTIIEAFFDLDSIKAYFLRLLPNIALMLGEKNIYASENVIENIKTYINKNYSKDLTLDKVSSLFFLNSSYCSFLFKEKTGENFIDYINKLKIEKAKELLRSSDDKVYKIAKTLGFENPKYFFRVFKKITNQTPEDYRKG